MTRAFLSALLLFGLLMGVASFAAARYREDALVRSIERREGAFPGSTRVVPECNCTVRYNGTEIVGRHYRPDIERLD